MRPQSKPRKWRERDERLDELYRFLEQSNISERNRARLSVLSQHADPEVRSLAELIAWIARVNPGKRNRVAKIARSHPALFDRMVATLGDGWWDSFWSQRLNNPVDDWLRDRWDQANDSRGPRNEAPCGGNAKEVGFSEADKTGSPDLPF